MSFSYSSGVITQTGTDTDLSGLTGLTGVTTVAQGSGASIYTIYTLDASTRLEVTGTLTHEPDSEQLVLLGTAPQDTTTNPLRITGTYNYGVAKTGSGNTVYSQAVGINLPNIGATNFNRFGIYISSTASFTWNGGIIRTGSTVRIDEGATLTINKGTLFDPGTVEVQLRLATTSISGGANMNIYNLTFDGLTVTSRFFTSFSFNTAVFTLLRGKVQQYNGPYPLQTYTDFRNDGNIGSVDFTFSNSGATRGNNIIFNNVAKRISYASETTRNGYIKVFRKVSISPVDLNGSAITGFSYYGQDYDSGNRGVGPNDGGVDGTGDTTPVDQDDTDTKTYSAIGASGSQALDLLIETTRNSAGIITVDDRATSDTIPIKFLAYNENITTWKSNLLGVGTLTENLIMTPDLSITEATKSTVDAYTALETPEKFYDRAKSYLYDNFAGETSTMVSRSGSTIDAGSYNVTIDATAGSAFAVAGPTITIKASAFTGTINTTGTLTLANGSIINGSFTSISIDFATAGTYNLQNSTFSGTLTVSNSSGGAVTVKVLPGATVVNNGPNITVDDTETGLVTAPNIIDGSRYQLYNVTQTNEIDNGLVSGGSGLSLSVILGAGQDALSGDTIRLRVTYQSGTSAKNEFESTALITSAGVTFLDSQTDNEVYNSYGIDGSTITQFSADYAADEVDITVASNFNGKDFYSWWVYNETTAQGIDEFFGVLTALDQANLRINSSLLNVFIDNTTSTNIWQNDNVRIFREDGNYPVKNPATSGGGGVDIVWRNQIFIAETGVSGLTASESSTLLAIPTNPLLTNDSRLDTFDTKTNVKPSVSI